MKTLYTIHKVAFYITLWLWLTIIYGAIAEFFLGCLQLLTALYLLYRLPELSQEAITRFRNYGSHLIYFTFYSLVSTIISLLFHDASVIFFIAGLIYALVIAYLLVHTLEACVKNVNQEITTKENDVFF
jgi:hypothetical protein